MATLTVSISGSALVNGTKSYTISDADLQQLLNWAAAQFAASLPANPTNVQILLAWVQGQIVNATVNATQVHGITTTIPPPINIT